MWSRIEEVSTGEVKVAETGTTLVTSALGSCIAIIAYDPQNYRGGIAHIMLPGSARDKNSPDKFRYAEEGIEELLRQMSSLGCDISRLCLFAAGGANVLKRKDDTVCKMNIETAMNILKRRNLRVLASSLGGIHRRRIRFEISKGLLFCTLGDGDEAVLWASDTR